MKMIFPTSDDQASVDSFQKPDHKCLCSRCASKIKEGEVPIRMITKNRQGEIDHMSVEYIYCGKCQKKSGLTSLEDLDRFTISRRTIGDYLRFQRDKPLNFF